MSPVLIVALQLSFEDYLQDDIAAVVRQYIGNMISSVYKFAMPLSLLSKPPQLITLPPMIPTLIPM